MELSRRGFLGGILASFVTVPHLGYADVTMTFGGYDELVAITRKDFLLHLKVQLYEAPPLARLLATDWLEADDA